MASSAADEPTLENKLIPIVERRYIVAFALVTTLFFSWAFAASLNDILIRQFQKALALSRTQTSLVQLAFYIGYFCAALPAALMIRLAGYKTTMLTGLGLYALGAFLFYPAAEAQRYSFFLAALYVIAFGLAFLETSANPYVSILGRPETASSRLNLAQSVYGLGAICGPIVGGVFIFSGAEQTPAQIALMSASQIAAYRTAETALVQGPYVSVGIGITLLALLVYFTSFPNLSKGGEHRSMRAPKHSPVSVLRHARLRWAIVAQFFYVGAQVGIWSFFIDFGKTMMPDVAEKTLAFLLSASLAMLMIGRFTGAFIQVRVSPARLLTLYAGANILLCLIAVISSGPMAVGSLWLTSFFMSIMFPTIFALGIQDLAGETELGASFLIMSIIGGAVMPPLMGLISDLIGGIHHAMMIPAFCFAVCLVCALRMSKSPRER